MLAFVTQDDGVLSMTTVCTSRLVLRIRLLILSFVHLADVKSFRFSTQDDGILSVHLPVFLA